MKTCRCTHMVQEKGGRAPPGLHGPVLALGLLDQPACALPHITCKTCAFTL